MDRGRILKHTLDLALLLFVRGQQEIRVPPEITEPLTDREIFIEKRETNTVRLKCTSTGRPPPTYTWYWNGVLMEPNGRISSDSNTGDLTINKFTSADDGVYICHANVTFTKNRWAVAVSPKIEVGMARVGDWPSRTIHWETGTCGGCYAFLSCDDELPEVVGPMTIKWATFCRGNIINDKNHFIDRNHNLHILFLKRGKICYNYRCGISNTLAGIFSTGDIITISITGSGNPPDTKPILRFHTGQLDEVALTFEVESDARLECVISGYVHDPNSTTNDPVTAFPTITWLNDRNETIVSGQDRYQIKDYGRALTIKNVVESDEKTYTCLGANKLGRVEATMSLNVTSRPIWVKTLVSLTVVEGQDAIFHCRARSALSERPPSVPVWYKNGLRFDSVYDPTKYEFSDEKRVVKVMSARKLTDIACFRCFVSNSVGRVVGAACLNVILPIEIITQPRANQVVKKGDDVDLTVVARSDPLSPVTYVWHFKNRTYTAGDAPPYVLYDAVTKLAFIDTANFSRRQMRRIAGLYTREIYNRFQRVTVDINIITNGTKGKECTDGFYGPNCQPCGMCAENVTCDKISGTCSACQEGYDLPYCAEEYFSLQKLASTGVSGLVLWASICGALLIALAAACVAALAKRTKAAQRQAGPPGAGRSSLRQGKPSSAATGTAGPGQPASNAELTDAADLTSTLPDADPTTSGYSTTEVAATDYSEFTTTDDATSDYAGSTTDPTAVSSY